jgi:hypothetical protein
LAYINFNSIDLQADNNMKIELDSLPPYIHNVKLSHRNVEFLIEKKSAENRNNRRNR